MDPDLESECYILISDPGFEAENWSFDPDPDLNPAFQSKTIQSLNLNHNHQ